MYKLNRFSAVLGSVFQKYAACGALAAMCLAAHHVNAQENLVQNPGFEQGLLGWHAFLPPSTPKEACKWETSTDRPHSGAGSLHLQAQKPERFGMSTVKVIVKPGERYKVSTWVRVPAGFVLAQGSPGVLVRVDFPTKDNVLGPKNVMLTLGDKVAPVAEFSRLLGNTTFPSDWTCISGVYEVPAGAAEMYVELFMWAGVGESFWDDVELVKVDPSTPLSPLPAVTK